MPPNALPHTVILNNEGNPWFSGNKNGTIGKLDPVSGKTTTYKMPDPTSDPHTLAFDKDGMLCFSFQVSNMIGRLNPKTGEVKVVSAPSGPRSHPYGIAYLDGAIWYNESGVRPDMLVRFDIAKESFQSWPISSGGVYSGILRNARTTREGGLLIHQTATNRVFP